jgi:hypothetical protein
MNSSEKEAVDVPDSSSSHTSPDKSIKKKPIGERASLSAPVTPCVLIFSETVTLMKGLFKLSELVKAQYELML